MGIVWGDTRPNVPDPVTTLTPKEKDMIAHSFQPLRKDVSGSGVALFLLFFKKFPEYQNYFSQIRELDESQLKDSSQLRAHGSTVFTHIGLLVDTLDDSTTLVVLLEKLGKNHGVRNIAEKAFWDLKATILELLKECKISNDALKAWDKLLQVAMTVIIKSLKP